MVPPTFLSASRVAVHSRSPRATATPNRAVHRSTVHSKLLPKDASVPEDAFHDVILVKLFGTISQLCKGTTLQRGAHDHGRALVWSHIVADCPGHPEEGGVQRAQGLVARESQLHDQGSVRNILAGTGRGHIHITEHVPSHICKKHSKKKYAACMYACMFVCMYVCMYVWNLVKVLIIRAWSASLHTARRTYSSSFAASGSEKELRAPCCRKLELPAHLGTQHLLSSAVDCFSLPMLGACTCACP